MAKTDLLAAGSGGTRRSVTVGVLVPAALITALVAIGRAEVNTLRKLQAFDDPNAIVDWYDVDDRVMGGVSTSRLAKSAAGAIFTGNLSLERGGGFASVRSPETALDLSNCGAIVLRVRGDGKRYKLALRTDRRFDGVVYQSQFDTKADGWHEVVLPLDDFAASWHGRAVPGAGTLRGSIITSFGLVIADRQSGPFRLDVAWIAATHE